MKRMYLIILLIVVFVPKVAICRNPDTLKTSLSETTKPNSYVAPVQTIKDKDWLETFVNIGTLVGLFFAGGSMILLLIQIREQSRVQRAEYVYRLEDKYDKICEYKSQNTDLMETAKNWENKEYSNLNDTEKKYFHYCEMVIGFIEIAIYMRYKDKSLSSEVFKNFISPMIILEVNYNRKLIEQLSETGIMSPCSKKFVNTVSNLLNYPDTPDRKIPTDILRDINWSELDKDCEES